jgi:hypothetical protein
MQVNITDRVQTTFIGMLNGGHTVDVGAQAMCGLSNVLSAVPVVVLNPNAPNGFGTNNTLQGSGNLSVLGAPKSIQVNSTDINAVSLSGRIELSNTTSGDGDGTFAVAGRELESDAGVSSTVKWVNAAGIVSDPFASIDVSSQPPAAPVQYGVTTGCPGIPAGIPCDDYKPGYYPAIHCGPSLGQTAAICVGSGGTPAGYPAGSVGLAVFEPGIYYLGEDFFAGPSSCLRSATTGGDGSGGTMFYLSRTGAEIATLNVRPGSGALIVTASSGATFNCASTASAVSVGEATCPGGNLELGAIGVSQLPGNVLLAPCTGPYGDPSGAGKVRGMLFFHDRDVQPSDQSLWSGSGALVGNLYFHHCHLSPSGGSGTNCDPDAFTETLNIGGSNTIVGGIVVDQLTLTGGSSTTVVLNPNPQYHTLKASLLQ